MILNYFIVSISFIYTNHTKWKSCYESHIGVDVEKFMLWGKLKNAIFIMLHDWKGRGDIKIDWGGNLNKSNTMQTQLRLRSMDEIRKSYGGQKLYKWIKINTQTTVFSFKWSFGVCVNYWVQRIFTGYDCGCTK